MTVTKRHGFLGVFGVLAFVMVASPSFAAPKNTFGARLGVYTDIEELFLGVEGFAPLTSIFTTTYQPKTVGFFSGQAGDLDCSTLTQKALLVMIRIWV